MAEVRSGDCPGFRLRALAFATLRLTARKRLNFSSPLDSASPKKSFTLTRGLAYLPFASISTTEAASPSCEFYRVDRMLSRYLKRTAAASDLRACKLLKIGGSEWGSNPPVTGLPAIRRF